MLLVALWLTIECVRGFQRMLAERRVNRLRIVKLSSEIKQLRAAQPITRNSTPTASTAAPAWEGTRKFRVVRKESECRGCHSFYLAPHDGKPLPPFVPGQFLTFPLKIPGEAKPVVRCYSLSAAPRPDYYRCTIKRVMPMPGNPALPPGKASHYFNEVVSEGDILDVKAPRGSFQLDAASDRPLVLIAAGVGITPLFCMLNWLAHSQAERSVHLFYGVRNSQEHIFRDQIANLANAYRKLKVITFYSQPLATDQPGRDFDLPGRIELKVIQRLLSSPDAQFYLCGPGDFMRQLQGGLSAAGVSEEDLRFEAFGPSSVRKVAAKPSAPATNGQTTVRFDRSGKTVTWPADCASLLELADQHEIPIESGCRAGNCGTCVTAVKSGRFEYVDQPTTDCEDGSCFPCICVPSESIVLDA